VGAVGAAKADGADARDGAGAAGWALLVHLCKGGSSSSRIRGLMRWERSSAPSASESSPRESVISGPYLEAKVEGFSASCMTRKSSKLSASAAVMRAWLAVPI
jgi:hypothetical protein